MKKLLKVHSKQVNSDDSMTAKLLLKIVIGQVYWQDRCGILNIHLLYLLLYIILFTAANYYCLTLKFECKHLLCLSRLMVYMEW